MVIHRVPSFVQALLPRYTWRREGDEPNVYLTFDDGPVPGVTDRVLELLEIHQAKATFFMVGDNVRKHPALAREVLAAGHEIGNHTFCHPNGFKTATVEYLADVSAGQREIEDTLGYSPRLFRPPYGRITPWQAKAVRESHEIIMWEVLSGDYMASVSAQTSVRETIKHLSPGAIAVFHDQEKTLTKIPYILESLLLQLSDRGLKCRAL